MISYSLQSTDPSLDAVLQRAATAKKQTVSSTTYYTWQQNGYNESTHYAVDLFHNELDPTYPAPIPWQCKLFRTFNHAGAPIYIASYHGSNEEFEFCDSSLTADQYRDSVWTSDLQIINPNHLLGNTFQIYKNLGETVDVKTVSADRKLFVSKNAIPSAMFIDTSIGNKFSGYSFTLLNDSLIVFTEPGKIFSQIDDDPSGIWAYCRGYYKTIVSADKIISVPFGTFYKLTYAEFETHRLIP